MTEKDIKRFKEQAIPLGYVKAVNQNVYIKTFENGWFVDLKVVPSTHTNTYIIEAFLQRGSTKHTKHFVTGHKDVAGPIDYWCKSLIAFNNFLYK